MSTFGKMSVARRAEIKKAVDRTRAFREWITENVPKVNVDLNVWLHSGTGESLDRKPIEAITACGTRGCLGGWAQIYVDQVLHDSADSTYLRDTFFGGRYLYRFGEYSDPLFRPSRSGRASEDRDDRRTCLRRLNKRVAQLIKAARQA